MIFINKITGNLLTQGNIKRIFQGSLWGYLTMELPICICMFVFYQELYVE